MGGFADQRDAMAGEFVGAFDRQRKHVASGFDLDAAENGVRLPFRGLGQFVVAERHQPLGLARRGNPHHAAAIAGQGHEHARALRGVKLGRDAVVGPRMRNVERQRRLMQVAASDADPGCRARRRLPSVGTDNKPRE